MNSSPENQFFIEKSHLSVQKLTTFIVIKLGDDKTLPPVTYTGGKPRNYHEIVLTQICSQATSGTRRGSFQAENWIKKGWCHVHFCFILQLRTNNGEIRQCSSV